MGGWVGNGLIFLMLNETKRHNREAGVRRASSIMAPAVEGARDQASILMLKSWWKDWLENKELRFRGKQNRQVAKFASIAHSGLMIRNTLAPLYSPYLIQRERKSNCQSNWGEVQHSSSPDDRRNRCHSRSINNAHFILGTTVIYRSVSYFFRLFRPSEKAHAFFRW